MTMRAYQFARLPYLSSYFWFIIKAPTEPRGLADENYALTSDVLFLHHHHKFLQLAWPISPQVASSTTRI